MDQEKVVAAGAENTPQNPQTPDLFSPDRRAEDQPSEGVYVDLGAEELFWVGEVQLPKPLPVELVVEINGWDYVYKLDHRVKSNDAA